ncbi:hypothetical protein B1R32_11115 [Abditibacterium utsteinense]|uniref:Uncharacterized protein n=1 Tax=Abditibacterium utsteinense TaxID=1960156 RepID=A0A2S8SRM0_9BACT|nr:hypothetical protein B1R32_11115 [Abditibacterium utsteinense]
MESEGTFLRQPGGFARVLIDINLKAEMPTVVVELKARLWEYQSPHRRHFPTSKMA